MKKPWLSVFFVAVQFLSLAYIGLTGPLIPDSVPLVFIELAGLLLGVWAVLTMRPGQFNIAPEPLAWSKLVTLGPYRMIRHPMYLALLLTTLPLVLAGFSSLRLAVWLILLVNLVLKMEYEERLLTSRYPDYAPYRQATARWIPGIF